MSVERYMDKSRCSFFRDVAWWHHMINCPSLLYGPSCFEEVYIREVSGKCQYSLSIICLCLCMCFRMFVILLENKRRKRGISFSLSIHSICAHGTAHPRRWFGRNSLPKLADFSLFWAEGEVKMYRTYRKIQNLDQNFSLKSWRCCKTSPCLKALGWPLHGRGNKKETILCLPLSLSVIASLNTCNVLSDDMKYKKREIEKDRLFLNLILSVCLSVFLCLA